MFFSVLCIDKDSAVGKSHCWHAVSGIIVYGCDLHLLQKTKEHFIWVGVGNVHILFRQKSVVLSNERPNF